MMNEPNSENLVKITDLTTRLGLTARSLRYYEQVGLIESIRPPFEKYRFFDGKNVERLKQIIVLRKMQIPVRDIIRIYENADMSVVVETFVNRIHAIDDEIGALTELKRITGEFLRTMTQNGVTHISALPLLYEQMDKQLTVLEERKPVTMAELEYVSDKLAKPLNLSIVDLKPMRVLTSFLKPDTKVSDFSGFSRFLQANGLSQTVSGSHERFEFQTEAGDVIMVRVPQDFVNDSEYLDYTFVGGLFAAAHVYLDENPGQCFRALMRELDANPYYQFAYCTDGTTRHPTLLENLISPDDQRELVSLFVPVKKRTADPALFEEPLEVDDISIEEIEAANPILWTKNVQPDELIPREAWSYSINEHGEGVYKPVIGTHNLSTGVSVKLPFWVDIEFLVDDSTATYGYGADEGNLCFEHGVNFYGVNKDNRTDAQQQAISFNQPIFMNRYHFPKIGRLDYNTYNHLTWIVGEKHFAVIINGEVRYCAVKLPYMVVDWNMLRPEPIKISANGSTTRILKAVRISQLMETSKIKIKEGTLTMITKRSNYILPNIHRLITSENGENYWFNGAAAYVMECLGEPDYGYHFFDGLTGDVLALAYNASGFFGDGVTDFHMFDGDTDFVERIFDKCGYASTFVPEKALRANPEMYLQTLMAYIDKGVPVIRHWCGWHVCVGYEDYGKVLLCMTGDNNEPYRVTAEELFCGGEKHRDVFHAMGWIFVGEKKAQKKLAQIYRDAIINLPKLLTTQTDHYCFGAAAFRGWADSIESDLYVSMKPEDFDAWGNHTCYVCSMATNSDGCADFLLKAMELNPEFTFLVDVREQYRKTGIDGGAWNDLETLGGGFNVTLEALQDSDKRKKIADKIREAAVYMDEVVRILNVNLKTDEP
jgi:DNA-binding transcriptional MerR regulator